jgi:hypothetical protein
MYVARGCHRLVQEGTGVQHTLREFYHSKQCHREQRTAEYLNGMIYDRVASVERSFVTNAALYAGTFQQVEPEFSPVSAIPPRVSTLPSASSKKPNATSNSQSAIHAKQ